MGPPDCWISVVVCSMVVELTAVDIKHVLVLLGELSKGLAQSLTFGGLASSYTRSDPGLHPQRDIRLESDEASHTSP
jgi:hypothetical protein